MSFKLQARRATDFPGHLQGHSNWDEMKQQPFHSAEKTCIGLGKACFSCSVKGASVSHQVPDVKGDTTGGAIAWLV